MTGCIDCIQAPRGALIRVPALLQGDLDLIFQNAMTYNAPELHVHKLAKELKELARSRVDLGRQGITDLR